MTDKKIITFDEAVSMMNAVLAKFGPDHVYQRPENAEGCHYGSVAVEADYVFTDIEAETLKPGCAWGHALSMAGVLPLRDFAASGAFVETMLANHDILVTQKARRYMRTVQNEQDLNATWGAAHMTGLEDAAGYNSFDDDGNVVTKQYKDTI